MGARFLRGGTWSIMAVVQQTMLRQRPKRKTIAWTKLRGAIVHR
jgi:hypothetical protein